ncbi:MAG TPA: pyruvate:ferredoxin (flavodoxin) oxidoreductase, partial [Calditrichia bacterium]|nr:pyruvate:ferredoxin (flavodoxin) oxidoreductase [Calditrichia bacterium]
KNAIKIIGQETDQYAQGYFVYDSKKAGSVTVSHLRFGKDPITATYLVEKANFIAVHHHNFLEKFDLLENADPGAVFLLNSPVGAKDIWQQLPAPARRQIVAKKLKFYLIDAYEVAKQEGMGRRINTIMQTCFFAISGILPREEAIRHIKNAIKKTYGKKGEELIKKNFAVVDATLSHLKEVDYPLDGTNIGELPNPISPAAPEFVKDILGTIIAGKGDELPVSAMPVDGTFPSGTACWEKRNIAQDIPEWDPDVCIQCGKCVLVCPHGVIRATATEPAHFEGAPESFKYTKVRGRDWPEGTQYTLQIAPEDCTGCTLCVEVCPAKDKKEVGRKALNMVPQAPIREREKQNWEFFNQMPLSDRGLVNGSTAREVQFLEPLFEFSGACAGCGETPYIKLATQLFGDRMIVANATGCSSIYGGNLPTTPWTHNKEGRGPAWANSLFEDNAEFGLGFRMTLDQHEKQARNLLKRVGLDKGLVKALLDNPQKSEEDLNAQRERVEELKKALKSVKTAEAKDLLSLADNLVRKSVWIIGGDGWAYDIGFGGLDHVIASGKNVNILVLDTEVYSNTGGQMSKATPLGAAAKFAASGKEVAKKDLALQAVSYGNVYVARIAMGANDSHTIKVLQEAEQYQGPSLVIAYSHCIAHGYNMARGLDQQKLAVETGYWPLFRFNPDLRKEGKNPFTLDSKGIKKPLQDYIYNEARYKMLTKVDPDHARVLLNNAQKTVVEHRKLYDKMVEMYEPGDDEGNGVPKQVLPFY